MKLLKLGAKGILTAISAVLYALSFAVSLSLRVVVVTATWIAASLIVGWRDAWPRRATRAESLAPAGWPEPPVLQRERLRSRRG